VERNDAEEVIRSMRDYFTAMERAIRKHRGLVLQYVGDEIEAVFGVPLAYAGHADKALLAALEMRKCLEELNEDRIKTGKLPFRHGIGIHTGSVLVGNTGSEDLLSYALVGNTVNVASRIQELTKEFNCDILVNEETVLRLENPFSLEEKPPRKIKGYSKPVTVFHVL
jgi:adenylate cyclase